MLQTLLMNQMKGGSHHPFGFGVESLSSSSSWQTQHSTDPTREDVDSSVVKKLLPISCVASELTKPSL